MSESILSLKLSEVRQSILKGKSVLETKEVEELSEDFNKLFAASDNYSQLLTEKDNSELFLSILSSLPSSQLTNELFENLDTENAYQFCQFILSESQNSDEIIIKKIIHEILNLIRYSIWLQKISSDEKWHLLIYQLIKTSNYNFGILFNQRVRDYSEKTLFKVIQGNRYEEYSWNRTNTIVRKYSSSLKSLISEYESSEMHLAFLMENSVEMASLDIACLTTGIKNVMIPANSVSAHILFILNQTKVPIIIASDEKQLAKIKSIKSEIPYLKMVVLLKGRSIENWVISFDELLKNYTIHDDEINTGQVEIDDLTTIMYTSGTTGDPKGIMFSQMNIVYKRFCRALALPKISDADRYLSFLPLFHTFGRYLELTGSIFWGAEYCFMENPSVETMISNMNLVKPTIFISIPKKWLQLFEAVTARVNIELDSEEKIENAVTEVTGGELKWGLSAAGFLPPEVFQFFQKHGIELMSGFGMTEATGGISMTPPGEYTENSLGKALPGIKMKVETDGELLIKGEYVMLGYYDQEFNETFVGDGWLPTGDIMREDKRGFIEIIDRKKEIYKNIKGETVAPQKIENFFRDFENIKQVFLVGDHRAFNTLLIYPNFEEAKSFFDHMDEEQTMEYFSSIIVTVNNFLAPFERIVDFRIIDHPFTTENGELTPKGTYKRRVVEKNFSDIIEQMYQKTHTIINVGPLTVKVPNWFLREKGCLSGDIVAMGNDLVIPKLSKLLQIEFVDEEKQLIKIGGYIYKLHKDHLDLQPLLTNASLWVGNKELVEFTNSGIIQWTRKITGTDDLSFVDTFDVVVVDEQSVNELKKYISAGEDSLIGLHKALLLLQSDTFKCSENTIKYLDQILNDSLSSNYSLARIFLSRPTITKLLEVRRELFKLLLKYNSAYSISEMFNLYLDFDCNVINDEIIQTVIENIKKDQFVQLIELLLSKRIEKYRLAADIIETCYPSLLKMIGEFGTLHPTTYIKLREILVRLQLQEADSSLGKLAWQTRTDLRNGFRKWLGENQKIAVDMETGDEYKWKDVIVLEEDIEPSDKEILFNSISKTQVLREAIFLFSGGKLIRLSSILPSGIWVSFIKKYHHKSLFRVSVQTRMYGSFDLILTIHKNREDESIFKEINWLIMAGSDIIAKDLVEDFGGYWREYKVGSSKYNAGSNVERVVKREIRKNDDLAQERIKLLWPFFVWNASVGYINFWKLTGSKFILADATTRNFIIPSHDYQTGTKILSLSETMEYKSVSELIQKFYTDFIEETLKEFEFLPLKNVWNYIISGFIEGIGESEGLKLLEDYKLEIENNNTQNELLSKTVNEFITIIRLGRFLPKRLFFAIKRFHRWFNLNSEASFSAQAEMLLELYDTYRLGELEELYPEVRTRFFLETVLVNSSDSTKEVLNNIAEKFHDHTIEKDEMLQYISQLQEEYELSEKEKFFLARLSYPHLKPTVTADFMTVKTDLAKGANLVIQLNDYDGLPFFIRQPVTPKEISRLHNLFIDANLLVSFQDKHNYIVAISERGFIIGGLFYSQSEENTVHMEKIVVSNHYRRKGISDMLMNEFFERMKSDGLKYVTTGFFRPEYFYRFGFKVEKKYSGLVKKLFEEDEIGTFE
ncbi:MAG: GNAT family N-acetyltransferase [Bacteroidota bacterium]